MRIAATAYHGRHISSCMDHARAGPRERQVFYLSGMKIESRSLPPTAFEMCPCPVALRIDQLVQSEMVLSELAAVVAGGNPDDARTARGVDTRAQRFLDRLAIQAVDDDLEHRVHRVR